VYGDSWLRPRRIANAASDFSTRQWSIEARFGETAATPMHSVLPARPNARFVSDSAIKACPTYKVQPMHIASQANYHLEIGFRQRHCDGCCIAGGMNWQLGISDNVSIWNVILVSILLCVCIYLISVTKWWDMIICLCMCKGRIGHANVLDFKSHWLTTNKRDIVLPITGKSDSYNKIRDETHWQNMSQWWHTSD